eukprot:SAG11_NODE_2819_length_2940_cov_31.391059_3_plen_41_part_00
MLPLLLMLLYECAAAVADDMNVAMQLLLMALILPQLLLMI